MLLSCSSSCTELTLTVKRLVEHPNSTEGRERNRERDLAREQEWATDLNNNTATAGGARRKEKSAATTPAADPTLSPIERFRRPPNKAFSVSDLISPAWCELQYWYTLTKYGRKRRTAAMKKGTTIHKTLEDEVHTTVTVEITTKEDALALRIWNIIQGLRTLREFGMTRELEVWGLVDGELVNGVIDQLSYDCPDPELEASAAAHYADVEASRAAIPEYEMSLTDYLLSSSQRGKRLSEVAWDQNNEGPNMSAPPPPPEAYSVPRIYLMDNKTRGSGSAPSLKSTSFRPTLMQLQMYYHMLNRLTTSDDVSIELLASRYDLDPERPFTDAFIAEVGILNDEFFDALSSQEFDPDFIPSPKEATRRPPPSSSTPQSSSQDSTSVLLSHNNLTSLWRLMKDQLRLTFLPPSSEDVQVASSIPSEVQPALLDSYPTTLSPLLSARYIAAHDSRILGTRSFLYDPINLTSYLSDQMNWWRGQRDPRGVEVMEAWKCRICEFQEGCEWRQEKAFALASRNRRRKGANV